MWDSASSNIRVTGPYPLTPSTPYLQPFQTWLKHQSKFPSFSAGGTSRSSSIRVSARGQKSSHSLSGDKVSQTAMWSWDGSGGKVKQQATGSQSAKWVSVSRRWVETKSTLLSPESSMDLLE